LAKWSNLGRIVHHVLIPAPLESTGYFVNLNVMA